MAVTDFGSHFHSIVRKSFHCHPVQLTAGKSSGKNVLIVSYYYFIRIRADFGHEYGTAKREVQSLPLSDRIVRNALMAAKYTAVFIYKIAFR